MVFYILATFLSLTCLNITIPDFSRRENQCHSAPENPKCSTFSSFEAIRFSGKINRSRFDEQDSRLWFARQRPYLEQSFFDRLNRIRMVNTQARKARHPLRLISTGM